MTTETLILLRRVLAGQQLSVGDPEFEATAAAAAAALAELDQAIEEAGTAV